MADLSKEWDSATPMSLEEEWDAAAPIVSNKQPNGVTGDWQEKTPGSIISNVVRNTPGDVIETVKDTASALMHPIKTLNAAGGALGNLAYDLTHQKPEDIAAVKQSVKAMAQDPTIAIYGKNPVMDAAVSGFEKRPVASALAVLGVPESRSIAGGVASKAKNIIAPTEKALTGELERVITTGIEKGVAPTVVSKPTFTMSQQYLRNAQDSVEHIIRNKNNLRLTDANGEVVTGLPQNMKQFSEAIEQTKRGIYEQYSEMAATAGKEAVIDLSSVSKRLKGVADSRKTRLANPKIAALAEDRAASVLGEGKTITVMEAQETLEELNAKLKSFYKNPTYEATSEAYLDATFADELRKQLDRVIETSQGTGYADLKRSYGALKTIEKDVTHRAMVDARKKTKGLFDLTDVFSGSTMVHGILSMNPHMLASGAAAKGIQLYYKSLNEPNRIVRNMFTTAEKIIEKKDRIKSRRIW